MTRSIMNEQEVGYGGHACIFLPFISAPLATAQRRFRICFIYNSIVCNAKVMLTVRHDFSTHRSYSGHTLGCVASRSGICIPLPSRLHLESKGAVGLVSAVRFVFSIYCISGISNVVGNIAQLISDERVGCFSCWCIGAVVCSRTRCCAVSTRAVSRSCISWPELKKTGGMR